MLLDFGKDASVPEKGEQGPIQSVDLVSCVRSAAVVCASHYLAADDYAIVVLEYEDRDWKVKINEAKFQRIITNGLSNAIKFCPKGKITINLSTGNVNLELGRRAA